MDKSIVRERRLRFIAFLLVFMLSFADIPVSWIGISTAYGSKHDGPHSWETTGNSWTKKESKYYFVIYLSCSIQPDEGSALHCDASAEIEIEGTPQYTPATQCGQKGFTTWTAVINASTVRQEYQSAISEAGYLNTTKTKTVEDANPLAHDFDNGPWIVDTSDRTKHVRQCSRCSEVDTASAEAHTVQTWTEITAATCTADGEEQGQCTKCPETANQPIPKTGHNFGAQVAAKAPTCTVDGNVAYYPCSTCKMNYSDNGQYTTSVMNDVTDPKTGHNFEPQVAANAPTCTVDGNVAYYPCSACQKNYSDNGQYTTSVIDNVVLSALGPNQPDGHDLTEWAMTAADQAAGKNACTGYTEERHCQRQGCTYTETRNVAGSGHDWGEWEVTTPATVDAEGEETRVCKNDPSHKETRPIDKLQPAAVHQHTSGDPVEENIEDSTCDAEGSYDEVVYCTACEAEISRIQKTIAKKPHTEEAIPGSAPTCTQTGLTEGIICFECDTILQEQQVIPAAGHRYSAWITVTAPTANLPGVEWRECIVCGDEETQIIPATGSPADGYTIGSFTYLINGTDNTVTLTGWDGLADKGGTVTIPDTITINGVEYKVTAIGEGAFANYASILKVIIGEFVGKISAGAFKNCLNLTILNAKNSKYLAEIGASAFEGCKSLKEILLNAESLQVIGQDVFKGINENAAFDLFSHDTASYARAKALVTSEAIGWLKGAMSVQGYQFNSEGFDNYDVIDENTIVYEDNTVDPNQQN